MKTPDANSPEGQLAAATAELDTVKAENLRITGELDAAKTKEDAAETRATTAEGELVTVRAELAAANEKATADAAEIVRINGELASAKAENKNFDERVAAESARIAAAQGGAPIASTPDGGNAPAAKSLAKLTAEARATLWEANAAIEDPAARRAHYEANLKGK